SVERERSAFIAGPCGTKQESHVVSRLRDRLPHSNRECHHHRRAYRHQPHPCLLDERRGAQVDYPAASPLAPAGRPPVAATGCSWPFARILKAPILCVPELSTNRKRPFSDNARSVGALPAPVSAVRPSASSSVGAPSSSISYPEIDPLPVFVV